VMLALHKPKECVAHIIDINVHNNDIVIIINYLAPSSTPPPYSHHHHHHHHKNKNNKEEPNVFRFLRDEEAKGREEDAPFLPLWDVGERGETREDSLPFCFPGAVRFSRCPYRTGQCQQKYRGYRSLASPRWEVIAEKRKQQGVVRAP